MEANILSLCLMRRDLDNSALGTCRTLSQSFVTHLLEGRYNICTVQELLVHKDARTIIIYTNVLNQVGK